MPRLLILAVIALLAHGAGALRAAHHGLEHCSAHSASAHTVVGSSCGCTHVGCVPPPARDEGSRDENAPAPDPSDHSCPTCELLKGLAGSLIDLELPTHVGEPGISELAVAETDPLLDRAWRSARPRGPPAC